MQITSQLLEAPTTDNTSDGDSLVALDASSMKAEDPGSVKSGGPDLDELEADQLKLLDPDVMDSEPLYVAPIGLVTLEDLSLRPQDGYHSSWRALPAAMQGQMPEECLVTIRFQATGPQDIVVGISSIEKPAVPMYEFRIGDKGNLATVLRKKMHAKPVRSIDCMACGKNVDYWITVKSGQIALGIGEVLGEGTLLLYNDEAADVCHRFVSFTNLKHDTVFKNIRIEAFKKDELQPSPERTDFVRVPGSDEGLTSEEKEMLDKCIAKHEAACATLRKRCAKFGSTYVPPTMASNFPWSLLKRISTHKQFSGGVDPTTVEEFDKAAQRAARFNIPVAPAPVPLVDRMKVDLETATSIDEAKRKARSERFTTGDQLPLMALQAQELDVLQVFSKDPDRVDPMPMSIVIPAKIHVFSMDKFICKQIRNNDVIAYFLHYGARDVEWLSDWTFNVVFGSAENASAALAHCSSPLPPKPTTVINTGTTVQTIEDPTKLVDLAALGWRLGNIMTKERRDSHGPQGQWVRVLLRQATHADVLLRKPDKPIPPQGPIPRRGSSVPGSTKLWGEEMWERSRKSSKDDRTERRRIPSKDADVGNGQPATRGRGRGVIRWHGGAAEDTSQVKGKKDTQQGERENEVSQNNTNGIEQPAWPAKKGKGRGVKRYRSEAQEDNDPVEEKEDAPQELERSAKVPRTEEEAHAGDKVVEVAAG